MIYKPPFLHQFVHFSTIIPNRFRPVNPIGYVRKTIDTADGDFLDLDYSSIGAEKAVLLLHGLEGSSKSTYILGLRNLLNDIGFDVVAMNHRSCSGRPNKLVSSYHSGKTDDVKQVVDHLQQSYSKVHLVGFSLGGNMALKYAGEHGNKAALESIFAISTPCDLAGSSSNLSRIENKVYLNRFLSQLVAKALAKTQSHPGSALDTNAIKTCKNFYDFDDAYTAPVHGFDSAQDYYEKSSSKQFISAIQKPTLIINALNDSFLSESCYPYSEVQKNDSVTLITPKYGGHVGFASDFRMKQVFWHEKQILSFILAAES
jgi:predicted alpha/beta-fold hydrolase